MGRNWIRAVFVFLMCCAAFSQDPQQSQSQSGNGATPQQTPPATGQAAPAQAAPAQGTTPGVAPAGPQAKLAHFCRQDSGLGAEVGPAHGPQFAKLRAMMENCAPGVAGILVAKDVFSIVYL